MCGINLKYMFINNRFQIPENKRKTINYRLITDIITK